MAATHSTPAAHRELSQPPSLLSPQNAPHIALGPQLRPPFLGVPSALCQAPGENCEVVCVCVSWSGSLIHRAPWSVSSPGYGFLPPAQAEMLARQQELLRKQSLAR